MVDTTILQHHTAGLEEQLGCTPLAMVDAAFLTALLAFMKFFIVPRLKLAKS